jgi:hyperosmotically inducible periplasmic protein
VADAAITASVNADLAKDNDLSALRIDVDTHNGHVTLKGTAPSEAAKERAARMAGQVKGVTSVDNQLIVQR